MLPCFFAHNQKQQTNAGSKVRHQLKSLCDTSPNREGGPMQIVNYETAARVLLLACRIMVESDVNVAFDI
jgi:hypothetical protein